MQPFKVTEYFSYLDKQNIHKFCTISIISYKEWLTIFIINLSTLRIHCVHKIIYIIQNILNPQLKIQATSNLYYSKD